MKYFQYAILGITGILILFLIGSTTSIFIHEDFVLSFAPEAFSELLVIFDTPIKFAIAILALATIYITIYRIEQTSEQIRITEKYNRRSNFIDFLLNGRFSMFVREITSKEPHVFVIMFYNHVANSITSNTIDKSFSFFLKDIDDCTDQNKEILDVELFNKFHENSPLIKKLDPISSLICSHQNRKRTLTEKDRSALIAYSNFLVFTDYFSYFGNNFMKNESLESMIKHKFDEAFPTGTRF